MGEVKVVTKEDSMGTVALIWIDPATDELRTANLWEGYVLTDFDAEDFGTTLDALRAELTAATPKGGD